MTEEKANKLGRPHSAKDLFDQLRVHGLRVLRFKGEAYIRMPDQPSWRVSLSSDPSVKWSISRFLRDRFKVSIHPRIAEEICEIAKAEPFISNAMEEPVFYRVGNSGGVLWYDTGRTVVRIDSEGWCEQSECDVTFVRYPSTLDQVPPSRGGSIDDLWKLIRVTDSGDRLRLLAWILMAFDHRKQHPLLFIRGVKGSSKSSAMSMIRELIDPNAAEHLNSVGKIDGLYHSVARRWVCPIDNISRLNREISDALCKMVTGDSISVRLLFTNGEERIVDFKRPVMMTSIWDAIEFPDLQDRTQVIELQPIFGNVRTKTSLLQEFNSSRPYLLGSLLDLLVSVLRELSNLPQGLKLKRMADYSEYGISLCRLLGYSDSHFLDLLDRREALSSLELIEGNATVLMFVRLAIEGKKFDVTPSKLLDQLRAIRAADPNFKDLDIARNPKSLGKILSEYLSELESHGIKITKSRNSSRVYHVDAERVSPALVALVGLDDRVKSFDEFEEPSMILSSNPPLLDFNDPFLPS